MTDLEKVASRLFWWKTPAEALADSNRFLAQVMTYGTIEDLAVVKRHFSESALRDVLSNPPAGVFDPRSWAYWHIRFGLEPAGLPKRHLPWGTLFTTLPIIGTIEDLAVGRRSPAGPASSSPGSATGPLELDR